MNRKPFFDFVRDLIGRPFRQSEVDTLDVAIEGMLGQQREISSHDITTPVSRLPAPTSRVSPKGIALIKRFEGCARRRADGRVEAYPDPGTGGDPWTIGWGTTGPDITRGTVWTQEQCDARLMADLGYCAEEVARALSDAPTSQHQFDALTSFHYNTGAIGRATLTRKHKAGDFAGAAREFDRWCYAGGRILKGLARRRAAEAELYRSDW